MSSSRLVLCALAWLALGCGDGGQSGVGPGPAASGSTQAQTSASAAAPPGSAALPADCEAYLDLARKCVDKASEEERKARADAVTQTEQTFRAQAADPGLAPNLPATCAAALQAVRNDARCK